MANTPQILCPDGVLRTEFIFSTTLGSRFFTGTADPTTVDLEVSVRGAAYTRDPDLIAFDGEAWTVPNPAAHPDGLDLAVGDNVVLIRAVTTSGSVSSPASVTARLIQRSDIGVVALPPTGITLEQLDGQVRITADAPDDDEFRGINVYASLYEGGGATGYTRVNLEAVSSGTATEEASDIDTIESESNILLNPEGGPAADPLYAAFTGAQVDAEGAVLQTDFTERIEVPETTVRIRTTVTVQGIRVVTRYSFDHSRTAGPASDPPTVAIGAFAAAQSDDPLYYVVTAVYFNPTSLVEFESSFSAEVVGHPLIVTATLGTFPVVTRQQIVRSTIESIFRSNPQVKVEPGSYERDTFVDPFSSEAERVRFLVDFLHRARTFAGLNGIDDPEGTGASVSVGSSTYKLALKRAFSLTKDSDVQAVIDRAYESLASNHGVFRRQGRAARGEVTFFTLIRPTRTIPVPIGTTVSGGSVAFRVTQGTSIPLDQIASFFDPVSGRYQVTVSVQASTAGSAGNVAQGQVRKVVSGVTGLSVVNFGDMFGGTNQQTNRELAEEAQNALASVDSGTARGYLQTAARVPGVVRPRVVAAGDPLMMRDLDATGVHRGGKVDVWIQGQNLATVTDSFAFAFDVAKDVHFVVIGDPLDLTFRAIDPELSIGTPIVELLDDSTAGLGLRNATTGDYFDLTAAEIVSFDIIRLSTAVVQPPVTLTDVVLGDYRRRKGNTFVLTRQPVRDVVSVAGTASGTLPAAAYEVVHPDDPLALGRSPLAGDYLRITPVGDGGGGFIPAGGSVSVTDEAHVLIGEYLEYLDSLGADPLTVVVKSEDGLTTYKGPNDPGGISDYSIVDGTATTAVAVRRLPSGDIASGDTVLVSYDHDENFTVTYRTNAIVRVTQEALDAKRHATADVLAKEGVRVNVAVAATVILVRGADRTVVDSQIRTNLANLFSGFRLGTPLRQSDLVGVVEGTTGVSYVEVPFTKLVRAEGSIVVRESLATGQTGDTTYLSWSTPTVSVWLIEDPLSAATTNGGGPDGEFRGVFQDDVVMVLVATSPSTALRVAGRAFIVGSDGVSIPGFSDDATLAAEGYATEAAREARREEITANRVLVSTSVDDAPTNHTYACTYIVGADSGVKNISPSGAEYLVLDTSSGSGSLDLTYDEDRG